MMKNNLPFLYPPLQEGLSAADRLADHQRRKAMTWPTRRLARRHNIRPHLATLLAETMGLGERGR
jgi:hypothetical protein